MFARKYPKGMPFFLFFLLLSFFLIPVGANSESPRVRFAIFDYYPSIFLDDDGAPQGFVIDFLDAVAAAEGWEIEYVFDSWAKGLEHAREGNVDLVTSIAFTEERATYLDFGKEPLMTVWSEVYVPRKSSVSGFSDLEGLTIGILSDDYNASFFRNLMQTQGLNCIYEEFPRFDAILEAVDSGAVDAGVVSNIVGGARLSHYDIRATQIVFSPYQIFFAESKSSAPGIVRTLDHYLVNWKKDADSPYHLSMRRWLHREHNSPTSTASVVRRASLIMLGLLLLLLMFVVSLRLQVHRATAAIRAQREQSLKHEEFLAATLRSIGDAVISLDAEGFVTSLNAAAEQYTGWRNNEAAGRRSNEVLRLQDKNGVPLKDYLAVQTLDKGNPVGSDNPVLLLSRDGFVRQVNRSAAPMRSESGEIIGVVLVFHDISEEFRLREKAEFGEQSFLSLFNNMNEGVVLNELITDSNGNPVDYRFLDANLQFERILGFDRKNLIGRLGSDIYKSSPPRHLANYAHAVLTGMPTRFESHLEPWDRHFDISVAPYGEKGFATIFTEVTEQRRAERALRESENRYRTLFETMSQGVCFLDAEGTFLSANPAARSILGIDITQDISALSLMGERWHLACENGSFFPETSHPVTMALKSGQPVRNVTLGLINQASLSRRWVIVDAVPEFRDGEERPFRVYCTMTDITERKQAEEALRMSEERLKLVLEATNDAFWDWDIRSGEVVTSARWLKMIREVDTIEEESTSSLCVTEELQSPDGTGSIHPEDREAIDQRLNAHLFGNAPIYYSEHRVRTASGKYIWVLDRGKIVEWDSDGNPIRIVGTHTDITEHKQAEQALRASEERLNLVLEATNDAFWDWDISTEKVTMNARWLEMIGLPLEDNLESSSSLYLSDSHDDPNGPGSVHPDDRAAKEQSLQEHLAGKTPFYYSEHRVLNCAGDYIWVMDRGRIVEWDDQGRPKRLVGAHSNITDRKEAEEALRKSEERLQLVLEGTEDAFWDWDLITGKVTASPRWWKILDADGRDYNRPLNQDTFSRNAQGKQIGSIHPDDKEMTEKRFMDHVEGRTALLYSEHRVLAANGEYRWILDRGKIVERDSNGKPIRMAGTHTDITERKEMEAERQKLETQLLQAQKLESLGVLAGGIAHDFNNLLTGILGHASLALTDLSPNSPARESLTEIDHSARRAADLCRQMLAYSGRGTFIIAPLNLCDLIEEMVHLLRISISKKVLLNLNLEKQLPLVMGDGTQIRQVIMNLVINASEAIGERSGVITISTGATEYSKEYLSSAYLDEQLEEGLYVWLEVSDTGCGMTKETMARLFEPFFTTKFTGRGLGLSAVLGIARSHKGALKVYSEPGIGTTFKILLPATEEHLKSKDSESANGDLARTGSGKVLLVDDEETIRVLGQRMLERLGFDVITAVDGSDAMDIFQDEYRNIDLVLLDLTMPKMNGEETLREMRPMHPEVRILMASGYSESDISARFAGKQIAGFLQKPYTLEALREKICDALEI